MVRKIVGAVKFTSSCKSFTLRPHFFLFSRLSVNVVFTTQSKRHWTNPSICSCNYANSIAVMRLCYQTATFVPVRLLWWVSSSSFGGSGLERSSHNQTNTLHARRDPLRALVLFISVTNKSSSRYLHIVSSSVWWEILRTVKGRLRTWHRCELFFFSSCFPFSWCGSPTQSPTGGCSWRRDWSLAERWSWNYWGWGGGLIWFCTDERNKSFTQSCPLMLFFSCVLMPSRALLLFIYTSWHKMLCIWYIYCHDTTVMISGDGVPTVFTSLLPHSNSISLCFQELGRGDAVLYSSSNLQRKNPGSELWSNIQELHMWSRGLVCSGSSVLERSPDHLLVVVQSLLGHVLDEGRVLQLQLPGNRQEERGGVQDVHLHLGLLHGHVLFILALWRHLETPISHHLRSLTEVSPLRTRCFTVRPQTWDAEEEQYQD